MMSDANAGPTGVPGARQHSPFEERRKTARFLLRDVRGSLSWNGESGDAVCEVGVMNISGGGAAVLAGTSLPDGQVVTLRLSGDSAKMDPVDAVVQSSSADDSGKYVVRLRFTQWVSLDAILERARERRLWERYPARESRATLSWLEGTTEHSTHGDLLNISGGGAAFVTDVLPPSRVSVWLELDAGVRQVPRIEPVESRLIMTSVDPSGMKIAHIQFVSPCPMDLFELAVNGSE
jgi:hypothetical protein